MTHGSAPHSGVDAVWVASQIVDALQGIAAREIDSRSPVVVSVGTLHAGNRFNIIAGSAELTGTVRTLSGADRDHVEAAMSRIVDGVCSAHRAECAVKYQRFTPVLVNDDDLTRSSVRVLQRVLGAEAVFETVEDFPYGAAFCRQLEIAGFVNVKECPLTFGIATLYSAEKRL